MLFIKLIIIKNIIKIIKIETIILTLKSSMRFVLATIKAQGKRANINDQNSFNVVLGVLFLLKNSNYINNSIKSAYIK